MIESERASAGSWCTANDSHDENADKREADTRSRERSALAQDTQKSTLTNVAYLSGFEMVDELLPYLVTILVLTCICECKLVTLLDNFTLALDSPEERSVERGVGCLADRRSTYRMYPK